MHVCPLLSDDGRFLHNPMPSSLRSYGLLETANRDQRQLASLHKQSASPFDLSKVKCDEYKPHIPHFPIDNEQWKEVINQRQSVDTRKEYMLKTIMSSKQEYY